MKDRRKLKKVNKERITVTVQIGTRKNILRITDNLSQFVDSAIKEKLGLKK